MCEIDILLVAQALFGAGNKMDGSARQVRRKGSLLGKLGCGGLRVKYAFHVHDAGDLTASSIFSPPHLIAYQAGEKVASNAFDDHRPGPSFSSAA
jgi:hypothetical protein